MLSLMRNDKTFSVATLYDMEKAKAGDAWFPAFSTFMAWNTAGKKYARLAAGGTLYFLIIIIATHKISEAIALTENDVLCVTNFLRHPSGKIF